MHYFQLIFRCALAAGDIVRVPGSVGQPTHFAVIAIDADLVTAGADLEIVIQFYLMLDTAAAVRAAVIDDQIIIPGRYGAVFGSLGRSSCRCIVDSFQLVFSGRLATGIIIRVPGGIGQSVDRAFIIFIDSDAAGFDRTVAAVKNYFAASTDSDLTVACAVDDGSAVTADIQLIAQFYFVISAASSIRCRRDNHITVAGGNTGLLRSLLGHFIQLAAIDGVSRAGAHLSGRYVLDLAGSAAAAYTDHAYNVIDAGPLSIATVALNIIDRGRYRTAA